MKCEMCPEKSTVEISWFQNGEHCHNVCELCAELVWNILSTKFTGTESFNTFTIRPLWR